MQKRKEVYKPLTYVEYDKSVRYRCDIDTLLKRLNDIEKLLVKYDVANVSELESIIVENRYDY